MNVACTPTFRRYLDSLETRVVVRSLGSVHLFVCAWERHEVLATSGLGRDPAAALMYM
jgi:hypothetical protein